MDDSGLPQWLLNPTILTPSQLTKTDENNIENPTFNLSKHTLLRLKQLEISHLFPVQTAVLPILMKKCPSNPAFPPSDLAVSASTGSGKTLAYCIPIIEYLLDRTVSRIRALILVPTRELALQVKSTFESFVKGTNLRVAVISGNSSFSNEQAQLVYEDGSSKIDILIATPGRLTDHINETAGFTLEHLRFLVIDEADRLLNQKYHDWLNNVLKSANQPTIKHDYKFNNFGLIKHQGFTYRESETRDEKLLFSYTPLQKLLFSATLTRNPGKLASLKLIDPKLISISNSNKLFTVPETLIEHVLIVKDIQKKPLALLDLLNKKSLSSVLIFAKSVQAAHRLSALLNAYFKSESSKPYSSNLLPFQKKNLLLKFKSNEIKYLVCSDVMSRGMDLGESVTTIINYDVASNVETFIHRIGRTARANRDGTAYSILEAGQKKWFMNEMKNVSRSKDIIELVVDQCVFNGMMERYIGALKVVGKMVKGLEQESNVLKVESDDMDSDPEDVLEEDNTISHEILENVENDVELEDDDETEDDDHGSEHDDEEEDRKDQIDDMVEDQAVDAESKKRKRGSALDEFLKT